MSDDKLKALDKAKKLKALADKGEGGERDNARELLMRHLDKHGLSLSDIDENEIKYEYFTYKGAGDLLSMIICHIVANALILQDKKLKNTYFLECTRDEALRIREMYSFYLEAYKKEEQYFLTAFLSRNDLTPKFTNSDVKPATVAKPNSDVVFHVKSEAKPIEQLTYSSQEDKKIRGLASWLPKYDMSHKTLQKS